MKAIELLSKLTLVTLAAILFYPSTAHTERVPDPAGVFYYQPASTVFGGEATWINPAGLGKYKIGSFQFIGDYFDGEYFKSWGSVVDREGIGMGYRRLHNPDGDDFKEYVFAGGAPVGGQWCFGASYRYFKEGTGLYHKRHTWNIGLMGQASSHVSWGAVLSNLNRAKGTSGKSEMEMRYSVGYRPTNNSLTLAVDMLLSTGMQLNHADLIYHGEFSPASGLYINGYVDNDNTYQLGIRVNLLQYFVGAKRTGDFDGHHHGSSLFIGATSHRQPSVIKEPGRRLRVGIAGTPQENPTRPVFGSSGMSYLTMLLAIYRAGQDPSIREMTVTLKDLRIGFGQAQELREAISYFRGRGKRVTCFLRNPGNVSYYIASAADKIIIPPVSQLNLVGLRAELSFYAGTLDKLGIKVDLLRIGKYKSAAETYTRDSATRENREQLNRILDDLYGQFVDGIAEGRHIGPDSVRRIIDNGPFTSEEAIESGLVDDLAYEDELTDSVMMPMPEISVSAYVKDTLVNDSWKRMPTIAVVVADGEVSDENSAFSLMAGQSDLTPSKMKSAFAQAMANRDIAGVVLRINSPGGLALAGDEIYHETEKVANELPFVVSMSNLAASGGYYIAMATDRIYANPGTITGSIGIFGGKADFSGLYSKIKLNKELFTRGKYAGMLATMRPFTDQERDKYFSQLSAMYGRFLDLVSLNRSLSVDSVDHLGQGEEWTGREAAANGLVDSLGGLHASLEYAAGEAGVDDYRVRLYPEKRPLFKLPGLSLMSFIASAFVREHSSNRLLDDVDADNFQGIFARMPYDLTIQ